MNTQYDEMVFAHKVKYRCALRDAWINRTGRKGSYHPDDVPAYIPTVQNADISTVKVYDFKRGKHLDGRSYVAYLDRRDGAWLVTTWTGDPLATVTEINSHRVHTGYLTNTRGTFWARGIDGKMYYGWHNGAGMYCKMRLSKSQKDMRQ